jgi:arsenate reductase
MNAATPGRRRASAASRSPTSPQMRHAAGEAMTARIYNALFLCTGNSARSIMAEAILQRDGGGRIRAFSAGSFPKGAVHPGALDLLRSLGFSLDGLRSKSWDEFAAAGAPPLDFIFTVCGNAAGETCPLWPGHPVTAHWGIPDPAAIEGPGQGEAFAAAFDALRERISAFLALPLDEMDAPTVRQRLRAIGSRNDTEPSLG